MKITLFAVSCLTMLMGASGKQVDQRSAFPGTSDPHVVSGYLRPADHCCYLYYGENFSNVDREPVCWDRSDNKSNFYSELKTFEGKEKQHLYGIDCGKNTFL